MVNLNKNIYTKKLSYYYIGHFSKFIKPGATRLGFSKFSDKIEITAFKNIDNTIVVVLLNKNNYNIDYRLCIDGKVYEDSINSHSIVTLTINK